MKMKLAYLFHQNFKANMRTMSALKNQIYFNVKQMLSGGFSCSDSQMNDSSRYTEWEHAGDLLGCRTKNYDTKTKYFGVSFSGFKDDPSKISVHMMGVGLNSFNLPHDFHTACSFLYLPLDKIND